MECTLAFCGKMKAVLKQRMRVPQIQPPRVGEQRLAYVQGLIDESMGLITAQDIFNSCQLQSLVDEIGQWCTDNDMQLNHSKCKELIISFAKNKPQLCFFKTTIWYLFYQQKLWESISPPTLDGTYISNTQSQRHLRGFIFSEY